MAEGNAYWNHYTQKVPYNDYKELNVAELAGGWNIVVSKNQSQPEWKKLSEPITVNTTLFQQNKHHLQQTVYTGGTDT